MNPTSPKNWKTVKLGDVASIQTGPFGSQLHESDYVEVGVPMITVEHLFDDRISHASNIPKVSVDDAVRLKKYTLQEGDIVFSRVGSVDRLGLVSSSEDGWMFSGRLLRVRPHGIEPRFAFYALANPSNKAYIRKIAVGATMPSLNTDLLTNVPLSIPESLDDQREIAAILGSLDNKIELLRRENKTLESIAQALFREWFVEFRFPGCEGVKVEGEVPEGWKVGKLGDVLSLEYGKPLKEEVRSGKGYPVIGSNGIVGRHDEFLIKGDGIVVGRKGTMGSVTWIEENFYPIDTTFYVVDKLGLDKLYFHLLLLRNIDLTAVGSDSAVPGLNRNAAYSIEAVVPNIEALERFNDIAGSVFSKTKNNNSEIQTLSRLRDDLLNKIFSN